MSEKTLEEEQIPATRIKRMNDKREKSEKDADEKIHMLGSLGEIDERKEAETDIAQEFSKYIIGKRWHAPRSIRIAHLIYQYAVKEQKFRFAISKEELERITYPEQADGVIKQLQMENPVFLKAGKHEKGFVFSFAKGCFDNIGVPRKSQRMGDDFIKRYIHFFLKRREDCDTDEIGGMLFLVHRILINKDYQTTKRGFAHRLDFWAMVEYGCFKPELVQSKDYSEMKKLALFRFDIFQDMGFVKVEPPTYFQKNNTKGKFKWRNF